MASKRNSSISLLVNRHDPLATNDVLEDRNCSYVEKSPMDASCWMELKSRNGSFSVRDYHHSLRSFSEGNEMNEKEWPNHDNEELQVHVHEYWVELNETKCVEQGHGSNCHYLYCKFLLNHFDYWLLMIDWWVVVPVNSEKRARVYGNRYCIEVQMISNGKYHHCSHSLELNSIWSMVVVDLCIVLEDDERISMARRKNSFEVDLSFHRRNLTMRNEHQSMKFDQIW